MAAVWPPGLPQYLDQEGFTATPPNLVLRSENEVGPAKTRREYTAGSWFFDANLTVDMTEWELLRDFYYDTLSCVDPFDWVDPLTRDPAVLKFVSPPVPSVRSGLILIARLQLEMLP